MNHKKEFVNVEIEAIEHKEPVVESPEGEYGEIINIKKESKPVIGDIESKVRILNPTSKSKK
jgi:hypothetical protein